MKAKTLIAIVLIVAGALALAYQGISYTKREQVVDVGPLEVTRESRDWIPLPPIVGGLALAAGVILLLMGPRTKA
jgi:hypothetical protein